MNKFSDLDVRRLLEVIGNEGLSIAGAISRLHDNGNRKVEILKSMDLTIDYGLYSSMITSIYSRGNERIDRENFPLPIELVGKKVKVSLKLFHFNWNISSEDVILEMAKPGYTPAILAESLFFIYHLCFMMNYRIVTLGSVFHRPDGNRIVPCQIVDRRPRIYPFWYDGNWPSEYCFIGTKPFKT